MLDPNGKRVARRRLDFLVALDLPFTFSQRLRFHPQINRCGAYPVRADAVGATFSRLAGSEDRFYAGRFRPECEGAS
jgi:hypothetical protein